MGILEHSNSMFNFLRSHLPILHTHQQNPMVLISPHPCQYLGQNYLQSRMATFKAGHSFTLGGYQHCLFRLSSLHPCPSLFPCFYPRLCPLKVLTHIGCPHCCCCSWSHLTPEGGREGNGGGNSVQSPWGRLTWRSRSECLSHGPESTE